MMKLSTYTKRLEPLLITLFLLALSGLIHLLYVKEVLQVFPTKSVWMLTITAVYTIAGCLMQRLDWVKLFTVTGTLVFFALCILLFYSDTSLDIKIFLICMLCLLRRTTICCGNSTVDYKHMWE